MKMILVNTDFISGKKLKTLQLVKGSVVQAKHIGKDFMSGLKGIVGGELTGYTEMMTESRAIATKRMVEEAESLGADGVINIRYASSSIMQSTSEILAWGTAVKFV